MISRFFIDRPIFANVIAIVTILFGIVALYRLPVERYPAITPPTVVVTTNYPGANAKVVADTVAAPIEQQVNGVENMLYMSSTSSADGSYQLTITFEIGTNLDDAQVLVQNRLAVATPQLPEEVRRQGVTIKKQSASIVLAISLTAPPPKDRYDLILEPYALQQFQLTNDAVSDSLARENVQLHPAAGGKPNAFRITVPDGFATDGPAGADKLRDIAISTSSGDSVVRLSDIGRVSTLPGPYDGLFLTNYATLRLRDDLSRVPGVGEVMVRGVGSYAMRVWINPDKLAARQLTTQDVVSASGPAKRPGGGRPGRPAAQSFRSGFSDDGHHARPFDRPGSV